MVNQNLSIMCNAKLNTWTETKISEGKRLTKCDMAWELGRIPQKMHYDLYKDMYKREEIRLTFNNTFNTNVQ